MTLDETQCICVCLRQSSWLHCCNTAVEWSWFYGCYSDSFFSLSTKQSLHKFNASILAYSLVPLQSDCSAGFPGVLYVKWHFIPYTKCCLIPSFVTLIHECWICRPLAANRAWARLHIPRCCWVSACQCPQRWLGKFVDVAWAQDQTGNLQMLLGTYQDAAEVACVCWSQKSAVLLACYNFVITDQLLLLLCSRQCYTSSVLQNYRCVSASCVVHVAIV